MTEFHKLRFINSDAPKERFFCPKLGAGETLDVQVEILTSASPVTTCCGHLHSASAI